MATTSLRVLGLEPKTYGLKGRCNECPTEADATTYESADTPLTDQLTDFSGKCNPADPELRVVIAAWPELPEAIRAGIVAMVKAAGDFTPTATP